LIAPPRRRSLVKCVLWSAVVAALWCLSMENAEQHGIHEGQASACAPKP
jgi:hypothetical protein